MCYIGSTIDKLTNRLARQHVDYKRFLEGSHSFVSVYDIFKEYEFQNCKIELQETYPCDSTQQLRSKDGVSHSITSMC